MTLSDSSCNQHSDIYPEDNHHVHHQLPQHHLSISWLLFDLYRHSSYINLIREYIYTINPTAVRALYKNSYKKFRGWICFPRCQGADGFKGAHVHDFLGPAGISVEPEQVAIIHRVPPSYVWFLISMSYSIATRVTRVTIYSYLSFISQKNTFWLVVLTPLKNISQLGL